MSKVKTEWVEVKEAFETGKVLNKWGNPVKSLSWYYQLIKKGKLTSKIEGDKTYILC